MTTQFIKEIMDGAKKPCPCCLRHAQVYHRKLNGTMANFLIRLYKAGGADDYVHIKDFIGGKGTGSGDFSKAAYWGLIVPMENTDEKKRCSGYWHLTEMGVAFVQGRLGIREFALVFDGEVIGHTGKTVYINDCIGVEFDYFELMNGE